MKFDLKNIILGIIIGVLSTILFLFLINDVSIDIRIGEQIDSISNLEK